MTRGLRFFFVHVLRRDWHTLELIRAQREQRLPAVLSVEEVRALLGGVRTPHPRVFLTLVYACGMRLQEAQCLEVSDIDSRRMVHVHRGKGAKDRFVPLPQSTLPMLRKHWATHRHPRWLFPAVGRGGNRAALADAPMPKSSGEARLSPSQGGGRPAQTRPLGPHGSRHPSATHLLEAGVNLRVIQQYLGHSQLETTRVYSRI